MQAELIATTLSATGAQAIALNVITGTPDMVIFFTGGRFGLNETSNARLGIGGADANYQFALTELINSGGYFSRNYPGTKALCILDTTTPAEAVKGSVTGFSPGQVDINVDNASSNFQVFGVAIKF